MLAFKLAFKNIFGAGFRTFLNIAVLSFAFVIIIWHNGVIDGFPDGVGTDLRRALSARRETGLLGAADSEVLFALALDNVDRWARGEPLLGVVDVAAGY